jgi:hypothetical protein
VAPQAAAAVEHGVAGQRPVALILDPPSLTPRSPEGEDPRTVPLGN